MNEVRLIDANALKYKNLAEVNGKLTYVLTAEEIDNAPTVETEEIAKLKRENKALEQEMLYCRENWKKAERPHGEWKHIGGDEWVCSECGHVITTEGSWEHPLSTGAYHCENCGADMRKGGAE